MCLDWKPILILLSTTDQVGRKLILLSGRSRYPSLVAHEPHSEHLLSDSWELRMSLDNTICDQLFAIENHLNGNDLCASVSPAYVELQCCTINIGIDWSDLNSVLSFSDIHKVQKPKKPAKVTKKYEQDDFEGNADVITIFTAKFCKNCFPMSTLLFHSA